MDIYLIRHGHSLGNGLGRMVGWSDHPLSEQGRAQAAAAAARLNGLGPMPVLCSDLWRAKTTAEIIAAQWDITVEPDPRWREICCGEMEDYPWSVFDEQPALRDAFDADPLGARLPGGESAAEMAARVVVAFQQALERPEPALAIVAHDGPIRAVLAHCLLLPPARYWTLTTTQGGLTHLTQRDGWISVRTVNDCGHLPVG
jgi:broad specificity phosphatase PhoE